MREGARLAQCFLEPVGVFLRRRSAGAGRFLAVGGRGKAARMIDLHTHSKVSDGQYSPAELVQMAKAQGLTAMALTDHDTTGGLAEAMEAARALDFELVTGVEMSAFVGEREIHLLGHFIDPGDAALLGFVRTLRERRIERVRRMIERLNAAGVALTFEEVAGFCEGDSIGRTHLAQALWKRGHIQNFKEAFSRFIGKGRPGFVERTRVSSEEAIALIHGAGGTVTLAHGLAYGVTHEELAQLAAQGLDGLEVAHPDHDADMRRTIARWAEEFDLVPTAGSDFHGERVIPERRLCECGMARAELEALRRRRSGAR